MNVNKNRKCLIYDLRYNRASEISVFETLKVYCTQFILSSHVSHCQVSALFASLLQNVTGELVQIQNQKCQEGVGFRFNSLSTRD